LQNVSFGTVINGTTSIAKRSNYPCVESPNTVLDKYLYDILDKLNLDTTFSSIIHTIVGGVLSKQTYRNKTKKAIVLVVINYIYTYNDYYLDYPECAKKLEVSKKCTTLGIRIVSSCIHMYFPNYKEILIPKQSTLELIKKNNLSNYTKTFSKLLEFLDTHTQHQLVYSRLAFEKAVVWYIIKSHWTESQFCEKFEINSEILNEIVHEIKKVGY
jgi:hypothetical protein